MRRLLDAAAMVYHPDAKARRLLVKATVRERKRARIRKDEEVLAATGIRTLRRQTVFTTPNFFPPSTDSLTDSHQPIADRDRKSTRLNSSHSQISYAVFCLKKKKKNTNKTLNNNTKIKKY